MAGYIFSMNDIQAMEYSIKEGIYSTNLNLPKNQIWGVHHEGTFADYITMKKGDNIFFFHDRKIYGIGELINIKGDCKFLNFPDADLPNNFTFKEIRHKMILDFSSKSIQNRMLCTFKGSPYFFKNGIDMDEVLSSNPEKFRMLRSFWKLSFIKIDDSENKALIDIILKNNEKNLSSGKYTYTNSHHIHNRINYLVNSDYKVSSDNIMYNCSSSTGDLKHEMALESGILDYISNKKTKIFGYWDYLSHQVVASPFKPIDYMDKMDIFGYKYIPNFKTISKYLVLEIKKDKATIEDINQVMKYVDWVNQEYSYGDYNMIEAFLVAHDFPQVVIDAKPDITIRNYIKTRRPPVPKKWSNLRLIKYNYNPTNKQLHFREI